MAKRIGFTYISGLLTVVLDGHAYDADKNHPNFKAILTLLKQKDKDAAGEDARTLKLKDLLENKVEKALAKANLCFGDVRVEHGVVLLHGTPAPATTLVNRIIELAENELPFEPLVHFMVNLEQNPSAESRAALFDFLEQGRFPLTDDGCFLGYKGVRNDGTDGEMDLRDCHTGRFNMNPGNVHEMPREAVDDNRGQACGAGFHVGTIEHARGFGQVMIVVKVNPRDCVSVPLYDKTKLRCCKYKIVNVFSDKHNAEELSLPVYSDAEIKAPNFEEKKAKFHVDKVKEADPEVIDWSKQTVDALRRELASRKVLDSVKEGRLFNHEECMVLLSDGTIRTDSKTWSTGKLAQLAAKRGHFSSEENARKAGRTRIVKALTEA